MRQRSTMMLLALAGMLCACKPGGSGGAPGAGGAEALEKEAEAAVMAEVGRHWAKGSEGWTTALAEGSGFAPIRFLRQCKELTIRGVQAATLDEADKLNGVEFSGRAIFNDSPGREAGDSGIAFGGMAGVNVMRGPGKWSQWVKYEPMDVRVMKVKGAWQVKDDTMMTAGHVPTADDWARAGVK